MNSQPKIYIAGHRGMVGPAIMRNLQGQGYQNVITRTHTALNLINQDAVADFFQKEKPDQIYLAAAKLGGIYPRLAEQPMKESALLTRKLEPTNEPYAIAKIAGIKLCESYNRQYGNSHGVDYRSVMPTNLYGPEDNYHPENSHVIPALIRRFHEAKLTNAPEVVIWGTGTPRREFLYVDDMAAASVFVMGLEKKNL
jgi:GDP-L-fucose synthase